MAVESGKTGKILIGASAVEEVKNWKFSKSGNVKTYASSSTAGYQKAVPGMFSGTVSFEVVVDTAVPLDHKLRIGDAVTLLLYENATKYFSVPSRIESIDDEVNIEEGEPPTVSVEASTNGAWAYPT